MDSVSLLVAMLAGAYVAGSINFSIGVLRLAGGKDPRTMGSGNPGATNVYRQAGIGWAAMVLVLDMSRAMGMAWLATASLPGALIPWVGLALIVGNRFPCFHRFAGGKGVANFLGFTLALAPLWALAGGAAWGAAFWIGRTPFLASFAMLVCLTAGTGLAAGGSWVGWLGSLVVAFFIVAGHHTNIRERWGRKG